MFEKIKLVTLYPLLLLPIIIILKNYISIKFQLWDYPASKIKIHKKKISFIGGLIIFLLLMLFYLIDFFILKYENKSYVMISMLLLIFFFIAGIIDDKKNINPTNKTILIFTILFILIPLNNDLVLHVLRFENLFNFSINLHLTSLFVTIFFIYIFLNLLNFSDGANGVAISLCIFFITTLGIERGSFLNSEFIIIITLLTLLILNINNKLFIGNSGCFVLGIYIPLQYIYNYNVNNLILCDKIFIIFLIPGLDMTRLVIERLYNSKSIFYGDLEHLHHILYKYFKQKYTWVVYIVFSIIPYIATFFVKENIIIIFFSIIIYFALIFIIRNMTFKR